MGKWSLSIEQMSKRKEKIVEIPFKVTNISICTAQC